jgi:F-box and leucine-rich repeat protein 2/20
VCVHSLTEIGCSATIAAAETCSDLLEELWERIFKYLIDDNNTFKSLSEVSKQFLSVTNRLRFSLKIIDQTIPFIPNLFQRFPNLTSLDLTHFSGDSTLEAILTKISSFPSNIKSLNVCHRVPLRQNGLRVPSQNFQNLLKSFNCTIMTASFKMDLLFIANCFPLLEELNLDYHYYHGTKNNFVLNIDNQYLPLPKLRKINLSCDFDLFHRICAWKNSELAARGVGKMEKMGGVF